MLPIDERIRDLWNRAAKADGAEVEHIFRELKAALRQHAQFMAKMAEQTLNRTPRTIQPQRQHSGFSSISTPKKKVFTNCQFRHCYATDVEFFDFSLGVSLGGVSLGVTSRSGIVSSCCSTLDNVLWIVFSSVSCRMRSHSPTDELVGEETPPPTWRELE